MKPKMSLLHPSRGRPEKSFINASEWVSKAWRVDIELIVSIDTSDPKALEYHNVYADYPKDFPILFSEKDNKSVVEATNNAASMSKGDILIYLSDDFKCPENWFELVLKEFEGETKPLLIKVDDCLQGFHVPVLTIPIMNRALYERLGYFWNPEYKSMFCDEDLYWTAKKLGALKMCPHLKFPHEHPANGKAPDDDTYRASAKNWNQGQQVFIKRKAAGFPV